MKILIDGCIFIRKSSQPEAQAWKEILAHLIKNLDGHEILFLNRSSAPALPEIEGIKNLFAPPVNEINPALEDRNLKALCDMLGIELFLSTGFTSAGITVYSLCITNPVTIIAQQGCFPSQSMRHAVLQANAIIVPAQEDADALNLYFGIPHEVVDIFPFEKTSSHDRKRLASRIAERMISRVTKKEVSLHSLQRYLEDLTIRSESILARSRPLEGFYNLLRKKEINIERAADAFSRGHYMKALNYYKSAGKDLQGEAPRDFYLGIAMCFVHMKSYEEARTALVRELHNYPDNEEPRRILNQIEGLSPEEIERIAIESPDVKYSSAQQLVKTGHYIEAVRLLEEIITAYPDFDVAHNDLGVLYFNQGNKKEAILHLETAIRLSPQNADFMANLDAVKG